MRKTPGASSSTEARVIPLFEMEQPDVEQCILTYRARMRTENAQGRVYLEMWCRFPGKGEFFSRGLQQAVMGHHRLVNTRDSASSSSAGNGPT